MKFSLVLPCYNEADNIPQLVQNARQGNCNNIDFELILVDNGSYDNTSMVLDSILSNPKNDFVKVVRINKNIGYGNGVITGLLACSGDILAWTHADLQSDINDVFNGFNIFKIQLSPQTLFIKGTRNRRNLIDKMLSLCMGFVASIVLHERFSEINAQPKIFHKSFLSHLKNSPSDFSFDLYVLHKAIKQHLNILEIPVEFNERKNGVAKGGGSSFKIKFKIILRSIKYIFDLKTFI